MKKNLSNHTNSHGQKHHTPTVIRQGDQAIDKLTEAAKKEAWSVQFVQLAWTAGPVTFLALLGGHYIGYGKPPATESFIYFSGFTVIAGALALLVRYVSLLTREHKLETAKKHMREVIDRIPELWMESRERYIEALPLEQQKLEGAYALLQNSHASPEMVATAVYDLTEDKELMRAARDIDVFRRFHLMSRVKSRYQRVQARVEKLRPELEAVAPMTTQLFINRMQGRAPNIEDGVARAEGFIERVLTAAEDKNLSVMTSLDAEQIFILAFELINGRQISQFDFVYRGNRRLFLALEELKEARSNYRSARIVRNGRLKALADMLQTQQAEHDLLAGRGLLMKELYELVDSALEELASDIEKTTKSRKKLIDTTRDDLQSRIITLQSALQTRQWLLKAQAVSERRRLHCIKQERTFERILQRSGKHNLLLRTTRGKGIKLTEALIQLSDKQRMQVVKTLYTLLPAKRLDRIEDYKQLAVDIALTLDNYIHLSQPECQYAIESSPAANFSSIEMDISAQAKALAAQAIISDLERHGTTPSERMAERLLGYYHTTLDSNTINWMVDMFGADREGLKDLQNNNTQETVLDSLAEYDMPVNRRHYQRLIQSAKDLLKQA